MIAMPHDQLADKIGSAIVVALRDGMQPACIIATLDQVRLDILRAQPLLQAVIDAGRH